MSGRRALLCIQQSASRRDAPRPGANVEEAGLCCVYSEVHRGGMRRGRDKASGMGSDMGYQLNLSGSWGLRLDRERAGLEKRYYLEKAPASVFLPGTTAEAGCGTYNEKRETGTLTECYPFEGYAWFDREIRLSGLRPGQSVWLRLERTRISHVWLDGQFVGSRDSFAAGHWFDLTPVLRGDASKGAVFQEAIPQDAVFQGAVSQDPVGSEKYASQGFALPGAAFQGSALSGPASETDSQAAELIPHRLVIMVSNVGYKAPGGHMTSPDTQTNWNGILGEIALYCYDGVRIFDLQITPDMGKRRIGLEFAVENGGAAGEAALRFACEREAAGRRAGNGTGSAEDSASDGIEDSATERTARFTAERTLFLQAGENRFSLEVEIPPDFPLLPWNEFTPNLYRTELLVEMRQSAAEVRGQEAGGGKWETSAVQSDRRCARIGFRDLHTTRTSLRLNDLPILLRGRHDGMVFPLTGHAPMEKDAWRKVFAVSKEYGINHHRFHTCCPPEAAFDAADEMGIYLEPEIPFWGTVAAKGEPEYDEERQTFLLEEGRRILKEFGNHPSFLMFSLGNELWGSPEELNRILAEYKAADRRHWYTQGSNNFQFAPVILENEDFFCGVRFSQERIFRGSYAMCDAPQGHVQTTEPENLYDYDDMIRPEWKDEKKTADAGIGTAEGMEAEAAERVSVREEAEIEIQFQTGTKKVKRTGNARPESGAGWEGPVPEIPVVSHEIGQYAVFPDFREIDRYTGVLRAENLKIFRERLTEAGLSHMAEAFFRASGRLAADCYRRELETAFRSRSLAGFQLLDLQDFPGQGTALVGILNAFLESKGLISPGEWRRFCGSRLLLLAFPKYVYGAGERFRYRVLLYNGNPETMDASELTVRLERYERERGEETEERLEELRTERIPFPPQGLTRLKTLYEGELCLPVSERPEKLRVSVSLEGGPLRSHGAAPEESERNGGREASLREDSLGSSYDIYLFPKTELSVPISEKKSFTQSVGEAAQQVFATGDFAQAREALARGDRVLYLGGRLREERRIEAAYCTDFWNYPMFSSISESMGKKLPVGTMGLYIEKGHPALRQFLTDEYTTPQWWRILQGAQLAVLDGLKIEPVVWMIDNFARNHRLGLLYEARVGKGTLLACQASLSGGSAQEAWLYRSLLSYASGPEWNPKWELTEEQLAALYE